MHDKVLCAKTIKYSFSTIFLTTKNNFFFFFYIKQFFFCLFLYIYIYVNSRNFTLQLTYNVSQNVMHQNNKNLVFTIFLTTIINKKIM